MRGVVAFAGSGRSANVNNANNARNVTASGSNDNNNANNGNYYAPDFIFKYTAPDVSSLL